MQSFTFLFRPFVSIFFLLISGLVGACSAPTGAARIAVAMPLTGDLGPEGQGLRRAVSLAVEEANASGKYPYKIEVKAWDDRAKPAQAVKAAQLIANDQGVVAVIGHYNSGCALAAAPVYARAGLAMVMPSASNPMVTRQQNSRAWPGRRNVFRLVATDDVQGERMGKRLYAEGARQVAIVHDGTAYGRGLAVEVIKGFHKAGGHNKLQHRVEVGQRDFSQTAAKVLAEKPSAVFFGGLYTEAGLLVKALRAAGFTGLFASGDGARSPAFFDVAGEASDGALISHVGVPAEESPGAQEFVENYRMRYAVAGQRLAQYDHYAYEAAWVVLDALAAAGRDRYKVMEAIRNTDRPGVLGPLRFDWKGDARDAVVTFARVDYAERRFKSYQ
jgi:branched-chain amino acid transport system substrate-binding protein